jgi:hypothetical protein
MSKVIHVDFVGKKKIEQKPEPAVLLMEKLLNDGMIQGPIHLTSLSGKDSRE